MLLSLHSCYFKHIMRARVIKEVEAACLVDEFFRVGERGVCDYVILECVLHEGGDTTYADWVMQKTLLESEDRILDLFVAALKQRGGASSPSCLLKALTLFKQCANKLAFT